MIVTVLAQAAGLLILAAAIYTVAGLHRDIFGHQSGDHTDTSGRTMP